MGFRDSPRELTAAIRTTPLVITAVGLGSLALLLAKILWLNYVPEAFPRAEVLGELVENILAATVAVYVFFLISYQVPQVIERRRIGRSIVRLARSVVLNVYGVYVTMHDPPQGIRMNAVTLEMILERFRSVSPNAISRQMGSRLQPLTWIEVSTDYVSRFCEDIAKVWRYSRFIDPELAALLDSIESSAFARQMELTGSYPAKVGNDTLEVWATAYFGCYLQARELAKYCDGYVKLYGLQ